MGKCQPHLPRILNRGFFKKKLKKETICLWGNVLFSSLSAGEGTEGGRQSHARPWVLPTE